MSHRWPAPCASATYRRRSRLAQSRRQSRSSPHCGRTGILHLHWNSPFLLQPKLPKRHRQLRNRYQSQSKSLYQSRSQSKSRNPRWPMNRCKKSRKTLLQYWNPLQWWSRNRCPHREPQLLQMPSPRNPSPKDQFQRHPTTIRKWTLKQPRPRRHAPAV